MKCINHYSPVHVPHWSRGSIFQGRAVKLPGCMGILSWLKIPAFFSQDFGAQGKSCEQTFLQSVWTSVSRQCEKPFFFRKNGVKYLLYCFTGGFYDILFSDVWFACCFFWEEVKFEPNMILICKTFFENVRPPTMDDPPSVFQKEWLQSSLNQP